MNDLSTNHQTKRTYSVLLWRSVALALGVSLAPMAHAQTNEWVAGDGAWTEATNWSLGHVPLWYETTFVPGTAPYLISVNTNIDFSNLWITNPHAQLVIEAGARPSLYGDLFNFGTILLNPSAADESTSLPFTADIIISGTGTIRLNAIEDYTNATLGQSYRITNGQGHTIAGSGAIFGNLTNHGTIIADGPAGTELRIGGGGVRTIIQSETSLIYAKTGDIHFVNNDITIQGGTLRSDPPARILVDRDIHLKAVHNQAGIELQGYNQILGIEGDTTNDSIIRLNLGSWSSPPSIVISSDTTLSGTGGIVMENPTKIIIKSSANLTNAQGHTISGFGYINIDPGATLINQGTLIAGPGDDSLRVTGHIQGTGSFVALDGTALVLSAGNAGPFFIDDINLSTQGTGEIRLLGGVKLSNFVNEANLTVSGNGHDPSLGGNVTNNASLLIYGDTIVSPDTTFSGSGTTEISIYGSNTLSPALGSTITIEPDHHFEVGATLNGPVINLSIINVTGRVFGPFVNHNTITGTGTINGPITNHGAVSEVDIVGPFINHGTVTGSGLISGEFTNFGLVKQEGPRTLKITGDHTQGTGIYDAGTKGIEFANCQLAHTTFNSENGGSVIFRSSNFDSIINNTHMISSNINESTITGSFVNNHTLTISGPANRSIRFPDSITIQGSGTIEMLGAHSNTSPRLFAQPGATLTINPSHTILGHGLLKGNTVNEGTIEITAEPMDYTAAMRVDDLTLSPSSIVKLDLGAGFAIPEKLIIIENGSLTLGGTLDVRFEDNTPPTLGQWMIIDGHSTSTLVGEFDQINLPPAPANRTWIIEQTSTSLTVTLTCHSDLNADFEFNFFDISAFITAFTGQTALGDFNNDGDHNFLDISAFLDAFNAPCQ